MKLSQTALTSTMWSRAFLQARIGEPDRKEGKYEVVGSALDGRRIGIICRITQAGKVRVITVYEDKSRR